MSKGYHNAVPLLRIIALVAIIWGSILHKRKRFVLMIKMVIIAVKKIKWMLVVKEIARLSYYEILTTRDGLISSC